MNPHGHDDVQAAVVRSSEGLMLCLAAPDRAPIVRPVSGQRAGLDQRTNVWTACPRAFRQRMPERFRRCATRVLRTPRRRLSRWRCPFLSGNGVTRDGSARIDTRPTQMVRHVPKDRVGRHMELVNKKTRNIRPTVVYPEATTLTPALLLRLDSVVMEIKSERTHSWRTSNVSRVGFDAFSIKVVSSA